MSLDPIATWKDVYPIHEAIGCEVDTLAKLHETLQHERAIQTHIEKIERALAHLTTGVRARYESWSVNPSSYTYASEAYYQFRILATMRHLATTAYSIDESVDIICARQVLKPSAFNDTPRINLVPPFVFIIFPAPTVYWMYEIMGMISAEMGFGKTDDSKINEYMQYIIAARTFSRWADERTSYAIDYLIDAIARVADPPLEPTVTSDLEISPMSSTLVFSIEQFVIAHEFAHLVLGHGARGTIDTEAEADGRAIEMLFSINPGAFNWIDDPVIPPELTPLLGYTAIRLWTNIRLFAECHAINWIYDDGDDARRMRKRIDETFRAREQQVRRTGWIDSIPVPQILRQVTEASQRVISRIANHKLNADVINRIRNTAKAVANGDMDSLDLADWSFD